MSLISTEFEANWSCSIANSQVEFNLIKKSHYLIEKATNLTVSFSLKTIDENAHINVHRETIFTSDEIKKIEIFVF